MSDIEAEMMNEWRRTRYIKAAGPSDRSDPQPTLTDAEREAVEWFARHSNHGMSVRRAATLRGLLERLSNPPTTDRP